MAGHSPSKDGRLSTPYVRHRKALSLCFGLSISWSGKRNFAGRDWRANSGAERVKTVGIRFADRDRLMSSAILLGGRVNDLARRTKFIRQHQRRRRVNRLRAASAFISATWSRRPTAI